MKRLLLFLFIFFLIPSCAPEGVKVIKVIDGDTIIIEGGERVRYIGIDAPEMDKPFGKEAYELNRHLVEGKRVRLEKDVSDSDRYGRLLRYVFVDGIFVNGELVRQGLARARAYPPDLKYQEILKALEEEAKKQKRGIWSNVPIPSKSLLPSHNGEELVLSPA